MSRQKPPNAVLEPALQSATNVPSLNISSTPAAAATAASSTTRSPYSDAPHPPAYKQSFPNGNDATDKSSPNHHVGSKAPKGKGKGKHNKTTDSRVCWNCNTRGHVSAACHAKKKEKKQEEPTRAQASAKAIAESAQRTQERHDGDMDALREINDALREEVRDAHAENVRIVNTAPRTIADFEVEIGTEYVCYPGFKAVHEKFVAANTWFPGVTSPMVFGAALLASAAASARKLQKSRAPIRDFPFSRNAGAAIAVASTAALAWWGTSATGSTDETIYINVSSVGRTTLNREDERVVEMRHGNIDVDVALRDFTVQYTYRGTVFALDNMVASAALVNACEESLARNRSFEDAVPAALHRVTATCSVNTGFLSQNEGPVRQNSAHIAALRFMRGQSTTINLAFRFLKA